MTFRSKVIRLVHKDNLKYLPKGKSTFLTKFTKRKGMVKVEIDFHWIKKNTVNYQRLMGRR